MTLQIHQFPCLSDNYGFLLHDPESGETAAIDTPDGAEYLRQAEAKGWTVPDKAQNYCFTNLRGKKTWSSFIWRGDTWTVSPRDRSQRVARYGAIAGATWKDRKGTGTYEFFNGGAIWKANNGPGKSIRLRIC